LIADGLTDPADELDAALGGPPRLQHQGRERMPGPGALLRALGQAPAAALIFGLVVNIMAILQGRFVEQEQIVGERQEERLRLPAHLARGPSLFSAQLVFEFIKHLLHIPAPPV
jgi:hypothetical protein